MYGESLSYLIRYFSNYYTLHRSDLAARAAPLDPRLKNVMIRVLKVEIINLFMGQWSGKLLHYPSTNKANEIAGPKVFMN